MNARPETSQPDHCASPHDIVVYARPGCPYCFTLRAGLRRAGVEFREINIWENPDAAAFVRLVTNGKETVPTVPTVPTVTIGPVSLVNPSARQVRTLAGTPGGPPKSTRRPWYRASRRTGEAR